MKFDSYPRFLRSAVFAECVIAEESGKPLPYEDATTGDHHSSANTSTEGQVDSSPEQSDESKQSSSNSKQTKRRSFLPWARIKSSLVTAKAASLSSMPPTKESSTTATATGNTFRRPMAVRKFASSITYKLRSRSLDEHIHNSAATPRPSTASPLGTSTEKGAANIVGHSSSVEQKTTRDHSQQEESLDLDSAAPVFSPSPDALSGGLGSRVASLSSCSTSAEGSPVGSKPQHPSLLRVTFPDSSSTVIACTQPSESLGDLAHRLLLKRGFDLKKFEVFKPAENVVS